MKPFLILFLFLATPLWAKTTRKPAPIAPAPVVEQQPAVPMARQLTVEEDNNLRRWITDIMEASDEATAAAGLADKHADAAEAEAQASRAHSAIAESKATEAQAQLTVVQAKFEGVEDERDKAIKYGDTEHKARVAADAHVSKIKTYLGFALGALLALIAEYVLAQITLPPPLNGYLWLIRIGAPVLAFGLGWGIVARFV